MQLLHQRRRLKDAWTEQEHCWRPWMALLEDRHAEGVGQLLADGARIVLAHIDAGARRPSDRVAPVVWQ